MDTAEDEGDVGPSLFMEQRDVLHRLAVGASLGVDLLPAAEDGDRLQAGLLTHSAQRRPSGSKKLKPMSGTAGSPGLDELVIGHEGSPLQLLVSVESVSKLNRNFVPHFGEPTEQTGHALVPSSPAC